MAFRLLLLLTAGLTGVRWAYRYRRFEVAERSMEPTLHAGDYVIASRYLDRIERGDVVVYAHPDRPDFWLVKRVVGVAGDRIEIGQGAVLCNGLPVDDRPTPGRGTWQVPPGSLFVLGDRRHLSAGDSRSVGPISLGWVAGRVVFRYWPPGSVGRLLAVTLPE